MSTNAASSMPLSKGTNTPTQLPSPSQSQAPTAFPTDRQRRSGSSFGAAAASRAAQSSPRNNQSLRKQSKDSKRPKLGYEEMSESAAIRSTSSRKGQTSITHLLNFTTTLGRAPNPSTQNYRGHFSGNRRSYNWGYNAVDKAKYIHANYRFIVLPRGNYHQQSVDDHLDWKDVLQVLVSSQSQDASCPICLSTPVAPRMAKCGHIFCLPCLIRYMHSTDDTNPFPEKKARWKKCPICWDSIYMSETRPVRWFVGQEGEPPREGSDVVLRLMKRDVGSTMALPRESADLPALSGGIPWYFAAEVMDYARVMKGSEGYMNSQFDREINDLEIQEKEDELMFGEETQWTRKAISAIADSKERLEGIGNPPTNLPRKSAEKRLTQAPMVFTEDIPEFYRISQAAKSGQSISRPPQHHEPLPKTQTTSQHEEPHTAPTLWSHRQMDKAVSSHSATTFYFYQALLHYYLAPLDIRILRTAFGDYSLFPSSILPRVERVSTGHIVDDDLRKRAKYLGHLPRGCEVSFLECDWTDIVASEILQSFAAELERRRKRNRDKEIREEKERIRAEKEEEDKKWAAIRRTRRLSVSHDHGSHEDLPGPTIPHEEPVSINSTVASSPPWSRKPRTGFESLASPSTSPSGPRTVWGTAAIAPTESPPLQATHVHEIKENDGWLQGWEEDLLREDGLATRVQQASLGETALTAGKKKKNKKITLMSTGGRRAA